MRRVRRSVARAAGLPRAAPVAGLDDGRGDPRQRRAPPREVPRQTKRRWLARLQTSGRKLVSVLAVPARRSRDCRRARHDASRRALVDALGGAPALADAELSSPRRRGACHVNRGTCRRRCARSVIPPEVAAGLGQIEVMTTDERQKLALWRMSVLGPLVSARLQHGDRQTYFRMAADRVHERPDGQLVRLSPRTIETWYRAYMRGGFGALMPTGRSDAGTSRVLPAELVDLVLRTKREKPRRCVRKIIEILERAGRVDQGVLTRSTVHRVLHAAGISTRPPARRREEGAPIFLPEHAGDLWLGDAMHGPRVVTRPAS